MKFKELREMSDEQLGLTLKETAEGLFRLRIQAQTERLDAPSELTKSRRLIARIKTLLHERFLANPPPPPAPVPVVVKAPKSKTAPAVKGAPEAKKVDSKKTDPKKAEAKKPEVKKADAKKADAKKPTPAAASKKK
jgi:large subunit ribosomal protein L29